MKYNRLRKQDYYKRKPPETAGLRRRSGAFGEYTGAQEYAAANGNAAYGNAAYDSTVYGNAAYDSTVYGNAAYGNYSRSGRNGGRSRAVINAGTYRPITGLAGMLLSAVLLMLVIVFVLSTSSGRHISPPELWVTEPEYIAKNGIEIASLNALLDFTIFDEMGERSNGYIPKFLSYIEPYQLDNPYMDNNAYTHYQGNAGRRLTYGVDVSSKQGGINWFSVRRERIEFAMIRAGSRGYSKGQLYEDSAFDTNVRSALVTGIKTGAYIYSQATNKEEIMEEAELILRRVGSYRMDMPIVLDFEFADVDGKEGGRLYEADLSVDEATEMCLLFCRTVREAGFEPMIYANMNMLGEHLDADRLAEEAQIWIAYPSAEQKYNGVHSMWQYSWKGRIPGIAGDVDMDFGYM